MSFAVRLSSDLISVEAGATMPLSIEVVNRAEEADRFELEVEGLDPEWTAVPVPSFAVARGDTATEKVFFRTPRTPESQSGNYPFVIKLRSLVSGEQRSAQGVLQVQPYHHISAEISPKKGVVASFKRTNTFTLTLINLGNAEHTLQLLGNDPDEELAFDFEQDHITLGPGQQKEVSVTVQPTSKKLLSTVHLHGFSITARSVDSPSVAAVAQAQLEARPAFTAAGVVFWLAVLAILVAWWWARPQPPTFSLSLSQETVMQGDTVSIFWKMDHADRAQIVVNGQTYTEAAPQGSITYKADSGGVIPISGFAMSSDHNTDPLHLRLTVNVPPAAPTPQVTMFSANPTKVRVGDATVFTYGFNDAVTKAHISPTNTPIDIHDNRIQIPITDEGQQVFTIIAENRDGSKVDKKSVTINGFKATDVNVIAFSVEPKDLMAPGGIVTVTWQLTNAVHAEISPNANLSTNEVDPNKGSFEMYISKTTTFTMTAKDKNNLAVTPAPTVRVVVEPPPTGTGTTPGLPDSPPLAATGGPR